MQYLISYHRGDELGYLVVKAQSIAAVEAYNRRGAYKRRTGMESPLDIRSIGSIPHVISRTYPWSKSSRMAALELIKRQPIRVFINHETGTEVRGRIVHESKSRFFIVENGKDVNKPGNHRLERKQWSLK